MPASPEEPVSNSDFANLKNEIDNQFPAGQFVAIEAGQIIADAESHREIVEKLDGINKSPKDMLIVQAGIEYPESAIILLNEAGPSR